LGEVIRRNSDMDNLFIIDSLVKEILKLPLYFFEVLDEFNVKPCDIRAIIEEPGTTYIATGVGREQNKLIEAAEYAVGYLDQKNVLQQTVRLVIKITRPASMSLSELNHTLGWIKESFSRDAKIVFNVTLDNSQDAQAKVALLAIKRKGNFYMESILSIPPCLN
jgi:cell division GTPase FtsZ